MQTRTETLASLLLDGLFDIPSYQRSYSWEESQLIDLIDDLRYLPEGKVHFFGNVILDAREEQFHTDKGRRLDVYDVVDGQQRLTTALILLHVAAQYDENVEETLAEDGLIFPVSERPRLLPQDQDMEFFRDDLFGRGTNDPETPSQERLAMAAAFFEETLSNLPSDVTVQELSERLRYECKLNVVEIDDTSEAASIFESLNDRGKPLSSLEKTKSFLMYMDERSSNRGALGERIKQRFGSVYRELFVLSTGHDRVGDFDEDSFQRFHWGMYDGYDSDEYFSSLDTLKNRLRDRYRSGDAEGVQTEIDEYTRALRAAASAFEQLFHPTQRPEATELPLLRLLELGRLANVMPVLMAAQLKYGDEDPDSMGDIIRACETLVFRVYAIDGRRSDTGRGKLIRLANDIRSDPEHELEDTLSRLNAITHGYTDDERFKRNLRDPDFYTSVSSRDIRYLLSHYGTNLDIALREHAEQSLAQILSPEFEAEHILARKLPDGDIPEDLREDFQEHVNRLGNLTIASSYWNKRYGNLPFAEKKEATDGRQVEYGSSTLRVQQVLANYDLFDRAAIDDRESEIVDFALDEWHVEPEPEPDERPPNTTVTDWRFIEDATIGDAINIEEDAHEALVNVIREAPQEEWVTTFFELLADVVATCELTNDDPRLVMSLRNGNRIAVSINNRYVLVANFQSTPHFGFILGRDTENLDEQLAAATTSSTFSALPGEDDNETPYWATFESDSNVEIDDRLRDGWISTVFTEMGRASASPYRRFHQPVIYKATVDEAYKEQVLDEAFRPSP